MAEIDRVEVLLQLAENQRKDNHEWRQRVWKEAEQRAAALEVTLARVEKEFGLLHQDLATTKKYFPQQQEPPKQVTQGYVARNTGQVAGSGGKS